jgi:hypothetical protein
VSNGGPMTAPAIPYHTGEPASIVDDNDSSDDEHLDARSTLRPGHHRRGRPHSMHGSGRGTPREECSRSPSPSPQEEAPSTQSASAAESGSVVLPPLPPPPEVLPSNGASSSSSASAATKGKEPAGLRRAARKLSLNASLFGIGLGLGLGGRDKDRDHQHQHHHQHHLGKEEGKKVHKIRPPSSLFGSGGSNAALTS